MIAVIKAEWRKNRVRPALLVASGLIAAIVVLVYGFNFYQATHPGSSSHPPSLLTLYPDQFVNNVMGAGFPLGAAMALVLGALIAGSEYSWGTLKTVLTQRPGRITTWTGRSIAFQAWMLILTLIIFGVGAACSAVVAGIEGHAIAWPAAVDIARGVGVIWLILVVNGSLGMALGVLFRQAAAALGVGLIYVTLVQVIVVRFITGFDNGAYSWVTHLFDGPNATALLHSFTAPPFGRTTPPAIGAEQAVLVLVAYMAFFLIASTALLRQRDVT